VKTAENALADHRLPRWVTASATVTARTWIALSVAAFGATLLLARIETENLLRSDDAYSLGFPVALFCAGFALVAGIAEAVTGSVIVQRFVYFSAVASLAILCLGYDATHPSSDLPHLVTYCGTIVAGTAAAIYPFVRAPITRLSLALLSLPGAVFLLGYWHAVSAMHARWS
jgi:hypothetical protein